MFTTSRFFRSAFALLAGFAAGEMFAQGQTPAPGTAINNQARAEYFDGRGTPIFATSNIVSAIIGAERFTLIADRTQTVTADSLVTLAHTLSNTGQLPVTLTLDFRNLGGDGFDLATLTLGEDANGNGVLDPGERRFAAGSTVDLEPGAAIALLLTGTTPATLVEGSIAKLDLSATSTRTSTRAANTDTLDVAISTFTLTADRTLEILPATLVTLPHTLTNTGPGPVTVRLDFNNLTGDAFDLASLVLGEDRNRNGVLDPDEPRLGSGSTLTLARGGSAALLLIGTTPATLLSAAQAKLEISATSTSSNARIVNTDTLNAPVSSFTLTADRSQEVLPATTVTLAHTLTNTGATDLTLRLDFSNLTNDSFDLASLVVGEDRNGNGTLDAGEPRFTSGSSVTLPRGASLALLLSGTTPAVLSPATVARLEISAFSTTSGIRVVNTDTLTAPVPTFTLTADAAYVVAPATGVTLPHTLTNTGPVPVTVRLDFRNLAGDNFDLSTLILGEDRNRDGILDATEPRIANGATLTVPPGVAIILLLNGTTPATLADGAVARVEISASATTGGPTQTNTDTLTARNPTFTFTKTGSATTTQPGATITYTISLTNTGTASPAPFEVTVDGARRPLILIRDTMPANTTFINVTADGGAQVLYRLQGASDTTFVTARPADARQVAAVAFGYTTFDPGRSAAPAFQVRVNDNASGPIRNTADFDYQNGSLSAAFDSNAVVTTVPTTPPAVTFYRDPDTVNSTNSIPLGQPINLTANAAACNTSSTTIERITVVITSALTGDREAYVAVETGPNTGIFVLTDVPVDDAARVATIGGDGKLQSVSGDKLSAQINGCGATITIADIQIDPAGVVFDTLTCQPVSGVTITLIDVFGNGNGGHPNQPAVVFKADGVTPSPNPVTTGPDGRYEFPLVGPSIYRIEAVGPAGSTFPSKIAPLCGIFGTTRIIAPGSNGETFPVNLTTGAVFIDVSLDVPLTGQLALEKKASRPTVEIGDSVLYTLELRNTFNLRLPSVVLTDVLPRGFTYEPGSARLDGQRLADPAGGRGPELRFALGSFDAATRHSLNYRVRAEVGAPLGDAVNRAQFSVPATGLVSNVATAKVVLEPGVFSDKGVIIGKVFLDADRDRIQGEGEPGIPGVRLYLEDGTSAVTDEEGKYSFYGVRPVTHTLKVDEITLPVGAFLLNLDSHHAGDPVSRFVDLKKGELHKANFAIGAAIPDLLEQLKKRRDAGEVRVAEIETALRDRLKPEARPDPISDARSLAASGTIGGSSSPTAGGNSDSAARGPGFNRLLPAGTLTAANSSLPAAAVATEPKTPLELYAANVGDNTPGFIGLNDRDTLPSRQTTIRVKGPLGAPLTLLVNGEPVSDDRLGKKSINVSTQLEAREYLGISLHPGENVLKLAAKDGFGNERPGTQITVIAPDQLASINVSFSTVEPAADGVTPVSVRVALVDERGTPVSARTPLTLETSLGRWRVDDLDPVEPGVQVFIEDGRAEYTLLPPGEPGDAKIIVSSGSLRREQALSFLPDLRPLVASGLLEGRVLLRGFTASNLNPTTAADAFEDELQNLATHSDVRAAGRAAFFLKGKVKGDYLLTASYDSDKLTRERLFRDIEPDTYYPVYGDSSIRGYDAQSTRKLYLRVDRKKSYLLLGDFQTRTEDEVRALGNYQRSLNGARAHYENSRVDATAWGSRDTTRQIVEEIDADGTSGPYRFRTANGLINSERVEILTRDRNQRSLVLQSEPQSRFTDYEFEPFTGRLLFRAPVRSLDENLNPRSIRVTYEVDQGGDPFLVYGGEARARVTNRLEVGGNAAFDENPRDHQRLLSANATLGIGPNTFLLTEVAQSDTALKGDGLAGRIDLRHRDTKTDARVFYTETDRTFVNQAALLQPGRIESGAKVSRRLNDRNQLVAQAVLTEDTATDGRREGVRGDWLHTFSNRVTSEVGARWSEETGNAAGFTTRPNTLSTGLPGTGPNRGVVTPFEVRSLRFKLGSPIPRLADASAYVEWENDVVETDNRTVAVGGEYQFSSRGRVYARHELMSSLGGPFELNNIQQNNTTVFGVETDYWAQGRLTNEYRARDAFTGREAEASTGLRNTITLRPGLRLNGSLERITPFDGTTQNESTSVTTGLDYTDNPLWKGSTRLELRWANQSDSILHTLGYARKLTRDWTLLGKTILYLVDNKSATARDTKQGRILGGLAWRQTDKDEWNALGRYEYRYEDGSAFEPGLDQLRHVHIGSLAANWQPNPNWIFSSRYAVKFVDETVAGLPARYVGHLLGGRALYEFSKRFDLGLSASTTWARDTRRQIWAIGPEVGFNFKANFRAGIGYNLVGFRERDLQGDTPTNRGVFLSLRIKFDENLFGQRDNTPPRDDEKE